MNSIHSDGKNNENDDDDDENDLKFDLLFEFPDCRSRLKKGYVVIIVARFHINIKRETI